MIRVCVCVCVCVCVTRVSIYGRARVTVSLFRKHAPGLALAAAKKVLTCVCFSCMHTPIHAFLHTSQAVRDWGGDLQAISHVVAVTKLAPLRLATVALFELSPQVTCTGVLVPGLELSVMQVKNAGMQCGSA
jgi:hypothetical protein